MLPTFLLRPIRDRNALPKEVIVAAIVDLRPVDLDLAVAPVAHQREDQVDPRVPGIVVLVARLAHGGITECRSMAEPAPRRRSNYNNLPAGSVHCIGGLSRRPFRRELFDDVLTAQLERTNVPRAVAQALVIEVLPVRAWREARTIAHEEQFSVWPQVLQEQVPTRPNVRLIDVAEVCQKLRDVSICDDVLPIPVCHTPHGRYQFARHVVTR
jgi:hypothetical protein